MKTFKIRKILQKLKSKFYALLDLFKKFIILLMNQGIKKIARFIFKIFCLQIKSNFSKSKFLKINKKNFRFLFSIHLNIFKISNNGTKCIKSIRKLSITVTHFAIFSNKNHICLCIWTISLKLKMKINFFIKILMLFKIIHF